MAQLTFGCLLLALAAIATGGKVNFAARNRNTIQALYNLTVFPNNLPFFEHGAASFPPGLFSDKIKGRVTPLGDFEDKTDSVEYFIALSPVPTPERNVSFTEAKLVSFVSGCPQTAASTVVFRMSDTDPEDPTSPRITFLKQVAFWRFDDEGEVTHYDAYIPLLTEFVEMSTAGQLGVLAAPEMQQGFITKACSTVISNCQGSNVQYESEEDCVSFMASIPFGSWDYLSADTALCRHLHSVLTASRPDTHCNHTGPTGGEKCVDANYTTLYFGDAEFFGLEDPFNCPP